MVELLHESSIATVLMFSFHSAVPIDDAHLMIRKFHDFSKNNSHRDCFRLMTHYRIDCRVS